MMAMSFARFESMVSAFQAFHTFSRSDEHELGMGRGGGGGRWVVVVVVVVGGP